jgi:hypothetical protein
MVVLHLLSLTNEVGYDIMMFHAGTTGEVESEPHGRRLLAALSTGISRKPTIGSIRGGS